MKEFNTDVLIVGSGLVGLVAAHCLSGLNYKVTLVDKKNFINSKNSYKDTRTVAVSEGSKFFLESLSLWGFLKSYAEPIKTIKVYDRSSRNKIHFNNQIKNKKLGYVIENKKFSKILRNQLYKYKNTNIFDGFNLLDIKLDNRSSIAFSDKAIINSKIIIAADGKNSKIKKIVGTKTFKKKYDESALVLNFVHEKSLNNTAYEIFYKTGPLAILPMKSSNSHFQSTIIWSNNDYFLKKLISLESFFVRCFLEEKIGFCFCFQRRCPLRLRRRSWPWCHARGGDDLHIGARLPDLRGRFAVPAKAQDVWTRLQVLGHTEVVVHRDVVRPIAGAVCLVGKLGRVIRVSWLVARRLECPALGGRARHVRHALFSAVHCEEALLTARRHHHASPCPRRTG